MKSTVAALGLMASLASATAYQPRHFHWRRDNSTAPMTTLTVEVTSIATITSCAPTVTNCPARSGHPAVVTNVIVLTEVVCPVTEAPAISSSVVQKHSNGGLPGSTRTAPVTSASAHPITGAAPGVTKSAQDAVATKPPTAGADEEDCPAEDGEVETTVTHITSTKTLTMTVGKGSTASVITTAVPTTIESTILITKSKPAAAGATNPAGDITTTTATSTATRTVTIKRPNSSQPAAGGLGGADAQCSCPSVVTVTAPASTVYITMGGSAPVPAPTGSAPSKAAAAQQANITPAAAAGAAKADEEDCEEDDDVVTLSTTVMVPYPTNGTVVAGAAKPTGAVKRSNRLF